MTRLVSRSDLGIKVLELADAFDMAYSLKHDRQPIIKQNIPLVILTNILSLFDILLKKREKHKN